MHAKEIGLRIMRSYHRLYLDQQGEEGVKRTAPMVGDITTKN